MKTRLIFVLPLLLALPLHAATYYVRTDGSDANTGLSPAQALLTIQGVYRKFPWQVMNGARLAIHLAGVGGFDHVERCGFVQLGRRVGVGVAAADFPVRGEGRTGVDRPEHLGLLRFPDHEVPGDPLHRVHPGRLTETSSSGLIRNRGLEPIGVIL